MLTKMQMLKKIWEIIWSYRVIWSKILPFECPFMNNISILTPMVV